MVPLPPFRKQKRPSLYLASLSCAFILFYLAFNKYEKRKVRIRSQPLPGRSQSGYLRLPKKPTLRLQPTRAARTVIANPDTKRRVTSSSNILDDVVPDERENDFTGPRRRARRILKRGDLELGLSLRSLGLYGGDGGPLFLARLFDNKDAVAERCAEKGRQRLPHNDARRCRHEARVRYPAEGSAEEDDVDDGPLADAAPADALGAFEDLVEGVDAAADEEVCAAVGAVGCATGRGGGDDGCYFDGRGKVS